MTSKHYINDRRRREELIQQVIGEGKVIAKFIVDKGHREGAERHEITDTGIIVIYNNNNNKMITKLIARPNQITRYDWTAPEELVAIAKEHKRKKYNCY